MVTTYGPIAIAMVVAALFGLLPIVASSFITPHRPNRVKNAPYECGVETIGPTTIQFKNRFYLFALVFVIFDVEAIFLFPWAAAYGQLGVFALVEMAVFVGLLLVGYLYAWRKRALEWM
jgi:NADH-quinone oxidoreductase subunit A